MWQIYHIDGLLVGCRLIDGFAGEHLSWRWKLILSRQFVQRLSSAEWGCIVAHRFPCDLIPAPAGSGIVFRRTDLDNFEIAAVGRNVAKVSYATSLMRQSVLISTTEHLLSALIGYGIDNVIVEVDNLEVPILDGSALPYVQAFHSVGIKQQRRKREYLKILKEVEVRRGIEVHRGLSGIGVSDTVYD